MRGVGAGRAALLAAALSGCAAGAPSWHPLRGRGSLGAPEKLFTIEGRVALASPSPLEIRPVEPAAPILDRQGRIYVGTRDGYVRCLSPNLQVLWEFHTRGPFDAAVEVQDSGIYVASSDGWIYALDPNSGLKLWSYDAKEELSTQPVVDRGLVFVASVSQTLFALDVKTGIWKWQHRKESPAEFTIRGVSRPAVQEGRIYMGYSDGSAECLDEKDGSVRWSRQLSTPGTFADLDAAPILDGQGHVFFGSYRDGIFSLDARSGRTLWQQKEPGVTGLLLAGEHLYATGANGVIALGSADGHPEWELRLGDRAAVTPALVRGLLAIPTARGPLLFIEAKSGRPRRSFDPGPGVSATPAIRGQRAYVLSNGGSLYELYIDGKGI